MSPGSVPPSSLGTATDCQYWARAPPSSSALVISGVMRERRRVSVSRSLTTVVEVSSSLRSMRTPTPPEEEIEFLAPLTCRSAAAETSSTVTAVVESNSAWATLARNAASARMTSR